MTIKHLKKSNSTIYKVLLDLPESSKITSFRDLFGQIIDVKITEKGNWVYVYSTQIDFFSTQVDMDQRKDVFSPSYQLFFLNRKNFIWVVKRFF